MFLDNREQIQEHDGNACNVQTISKGPLLRSVNFAE